MIQPKSSRLLSFSVEAACLSDADATPAPAPAPAPRPKSLTRRESPLAAAARRAREAMARKAAPRAKEGPVKEQDGPIKARESPVKARAKDSPVKTSGKEGPVKAKETKEGPKAKAVPKPAARTTPYAARSLIERPKVESKVLEKKLGKSETSETSAGSTPKCVLLEDTSNMTNRVERAEILEAAQVLRKEAQDLGQALRQWVAEAEAEAEDAKGRTSSVAISEATCRSNEHDEAPEVHLVLDGAEARPNSPVLADPTREAHGRQRLEHECERLDADLQRVAGEWHRLWSERQRAIEALTNTERSRVSAPPVPLPLPARATLGTLPGNTVAQAPCPARATVPALHQARSLARTPSPIAVDLKLFEKKRLDEQWYRNIKDLWTGPGTHIGQLADQWPGFEKGTVVGIDVDMNDGSLAFWGNGKFLGVVKDNEGKPVNLKGKKVVPAMSVFGRDSGNFKQNTVMEIRTGLDAPARP